MGFQVKKLTVVKIFRDWNVWDKMRYTNYPNLPVKSYDIKLWTPEEAQAYVSQRFAMHLTTPPPACNDKDTWTKPDVFAVMLDARKSAIKLHPDMASAQAHVEELRKDPKYRKRMPRVEVRKGQPIRCMGKGGKSYCIVSAVCPQWQAIRSQYEKPEFEEGEQENKEEVKNNGETN
jgi:hypothetical protein